eukprot:3067670-Pleurochrysis_carterae.AAC.1
MILSLYYVDDYVCGASRSETFLNPGLDENTWSVHERIFHPLVPVAERYDPTKTGAAKGAQLLDAAAAAHATTRPPAPSSRVPAASSRRKRAAPASGFGAGTDEAELLAVDAEAVHALDLDGVREEADADALSAVLDVMRLWETYYDIRTAWRDKWTADNEEYRAMRALRILRADLTITRIGERARKYGAHNDTAPSLAVEQLLARVAAQEENWHSDTATFATPEKLRLHHQQLRSCRLKCEMQEPLGARPSDCCLFARRKSSS